MWSILRYLHPVKMNEVKLSDLKQYENTLNFKNINFPVKLKDISLFEKQNPNIRQINVLLINDNNTFNPLRLNNQNCQNAIDLFHYEKMELSLLMNE